MPHAWRVALLIAGLALLPARAQTFTPAEGAAGRWGHPYGWLGPLGAHVWEQYRKDAFPDAYPAVVATDLGSGAVAFHNAREQGHTVDGVDESLSITPGTFFGASHALTSPPGSVVSLGALSNDYYDIRLGFFEDQGAGGGASAAAFVAHQGGDGGGTMDPFFGNWGVDGLFVNFQLFTNTATWGFTNPGVTLKAASSFQLQQPTAPGTLTLLPPAVSQGVGAYDLGIPVSQSVTLEWRLDQSGGVTTFEGAIGGVPFRWVVDDGLTRHGLTDPAATDGVPYQGGSLDLNALVPHLFIGVGGEPGTPPPEVPMTLTLTGSLPTLELSPRAKLDQPLTVTVTARNEAGAVDTAYTRTVAWSSSDAAALLPAPYTFQPSDRGTHAFTVKFGSEGSHSLTVRDPQTPALQSTVPAVQIEGVYRVGCGAVPLFPWGLLGGLLWRARRRRARQPG